MALKSFDEITWATPENPRGLWAYCVVCNKDIRELRSRKNTCSEECCDLKIKEIDRKAYMGKMSRDPDYAKKLSARQYARIKADPEKMEAKRIAQNERMQMPNYKASAKKSNAKYRSKADTKAKIAKRMRKYRDENPELIAQIERKRLDKRIAERERLKLEEPEKYQELRDTERAGEKRRKAEKRLVELQMGMQIMGNINE